MVIEAIVETPSIPAWLGWVLGFSGLLLGSGGVAAVVKAVSDRRQGIDSHEVAEEDAIIDRWRALSDAQIKVLLEPLQNRLSAVEDEVEALKEELKVSRAKYWRAIAYIRVLLTWITRHVPESAPPPPDPSAALAEDI